MYSDWPGPGPERTQACCVSSVAGLAYVWAALLSVEGRAWWRNTYKSKNTTPTLSQLKTSILTHLLCRGYLKSSLSLSQLSCHYNHIWDMRRLLCKCWLGNINNNHKTTVLLCCLLVHSRYRRFHNKSPLPVRLRVGYGSRTGSEYTGNHKNYCTSRS